MGAALGPAGRSRGRLAALQARRLQAAQEALIARLTAPPIGAHVIGGTQGVLNGLAIRVDARQVEAIRQLPGVAGVRLLRLGTLTAPVQPPDQPRLRPRTGDPPEFPGQTVLPRTG